MVEHSRFRHLKGKVVKPQVDNLHVGKGGWNTLGLAVNSQFMASIWKTTGGGSVSVVPIPKDENFKLPDDGWPVLRAHSDEILDFKWNPGNDHMLATCGRDELVKIWTIPDSGLESDQTSPTSTLQGQLKVSLLSFNPIACGILLSASSMIKIWDLESGSEATSLDSVAEDEITSISWNENASSIAVASKDKHLRIVDPRAKSVVSQTLAYESAKGFSTHWLGNSPRIFTCGFSKSLQRLFSIWDSRAMEKPLATHIIDSSPSTMLSCFDEDTNVVYLGGKGDSIIRPFELTDSAPYYLPCAEMTFPTPQNAVVLMPKVVVNVGQVEVARLMRLHDNTAETVSMSVPRRSTNVFYPELFPETKECVSLLSPPEWLSGRNSDPRRVSLRPEGMEDAPTVEEVVAKREPSKYAGPQENAEEKCLDSLHDMITRGYKEDDPNCFQNQQNQPEGEGWGVDEDEWED